MAKKKKQPATANKKAEAKPQKSTSTLFERIEKVLDKRHHLIASIITGIALIMAFMMFDAKISTGLDDSTYIEQGYKYSKDFFGHSFTSQAPFYAMVLALPITIFGINLVALKVITLLFFVASVYILYRAFRFKVSWLVLFPALFIYATNVEALSIASLTYTEALYLFFQALFLWGALGVVSKLNNDDSISQTIKQHWLLLLGMSIVFYFLFFTRTVGIAALAVFVVFYALRKEWKLLAIVPGFMIITFLGFEGVKGLLWEKTDQVTTQSNILFQKDAYDASQGNEDFSGFITRMLENTNQFISARFYEILGFRTFPAEWNWGLTLFTLIPLFVALFVAFKSKEKTQLFNLLFIGAICGFTFLALQVSWGQSRYIMILLLNIFIAFFWLLTRWFSKETTKGYQFFGLLIMAIFVLSNFTTSYKKAQKNIPIAKANLLKGDKYMGYTLDWVNFLKMSEYCGDSLPKEAFVASRKAPMSFLYANGKEFYPIWRTDNNPDPDSTLRVWKEAGVTHVLVGSLRVNRLAAGQGIINTVHRVLQPIDEKYPGKLEVVKQIGELEEARLIKINY
ncbi:MAG: hypothetical protein RLZZ337_717 [Bacteroidota bacterium]|jgi:uncharacterized membrane protein (Fun14 family)